jgi:ketosteroid isomerase-like protein
MHPNEKVIHDLYEAFARLDADGMAKCYHPDVQFTDTVFPMLKGPEVMGMWRMLTSRAKDFTLTHDQVSADDAGGRAHWEAKYLFSKTGRRVHNRIDAVFAFRDGLIIRHIDRFSFWRWAAQALGPIGLVMGWFPPLKWKVRKQAREGLQQFMERDS